MASDDLELKSLAALLEEQSAILVWLKDALTRLKREAEENRRRLLKLPLHASLGLNQISRLQTWVASFGLSALMLA